jgi:energy-coupling factor transporter ATP-binding protein EcfA2
MGRVGKKIKMKRWKQSIADIERNKLIRDKPCLLNTKNKKELDVMDICVKNCNSIDEANIKVEAGFLNIKFGINGTGKSTLAKAIEINSQGQSKLSALTPFKFKENNPDNIEPTVEGCDDINSVAVFNEEYVSQFIFKQDELVQNSFEIFVKNAEYDNRLSEIEGIVADIKTTFSENDEIDQVVSDLFELSGCFGKAKAGYSKASPIGKGISKGNKIENIPEGLESYTEFLQSDNNTNWIKWQVKGNDYLDISDNCPYCTSPAKEKHEEIKRVGNEFDAKSIEHLTKVISVVERLGKYFSEEARDQIFSITKNKTGLSEEDDNYLGQVRGQIDILKNKMTALKNITFFTFEDVSKVVEAIEPLQINLNSLPYMKSDDTEVIVNKLNGSLDTVLGMAGPLQGQVNRQKEGIRKTIEERKGEINGFLKYAGYKYSVDIEGNDKEYKLKLLHDDMTGSVSGGSQHLSYGERNAFSIVLFMYQCISNNPDLIILDDPISSFDKNKKYALLDMLFTGQVSLKGKTVLMLTHDLEPIIDLVRTLSARFSDPKPKAYFLKLRGGVVSESEITKSDIQTFAQICDENIALNEEVYQLLSNLLHKIETPIDKSGDESVEMTGEDIASASHTISEKIDGFDYDSILARLGDTEELKGIYQQCGSDYEKLQVFRLINEKHENEVIRKYINESYHIGNEYICQLNPCKYEVIPEFIVDECDKYFEVDA